MTDQELVEAIINSYVERRGELRLEERRHFIYRSWLATRRPDLQKIFFEEIGPRSQERSRVILRRYDEDRTRDFEGTRRHIRRYRSRKRKANDAGKKAQWQQHPRLYALHKLIWALYFRQIFGASAQTDYSSEWSAGWSELKKSPAFIREAPVAATNLVYQASNIGWRSHEQEYCQLFRQAFPGDVLKSQVGLINYVYGLTHIVIGAADFYRRAVDQNQYRWVSDQLIAYLERIYDETTLDINTEVALVLQMLGADAADYVARVKERLRATFDRRLGYIAGPGRQDFSFAEHTNAVALLLFNYDHESAVAP